MRKTFITIIAFLLLFPLAAEGEQVTSKEIEKKGPSNVTVKSESLLIRQKNFLHRVIEDFDKSITYMVEDIENLESRIDRITLFESERRGEDLVSIKEGYESHLKWLYKMKEAFDVDYESYFTGQTPKEGWIKRCGVIIKGYERFQIKVLHALGDYETKREKLVYFLNRQRFLMTETESLRNEIAALENMRGATPPDENYIKSLKNKLWAYQVEMNAIAPYKEEMYFHYLLLIEQLREKRDWLVMKTEEYKALESLANALIAEGEDRVRLSYGKVVLTYEKEMSQLKKKVDLMGAKDWSVTPYGEIRVVERFEELIDYFKLMKSRYGDYKSLLDVQADGFRADMEMKARKD